MWLVAEILGSLASPQIFKAFGYYGNYTVYQICLIFTVIYIIMYVTEPISKKYPRIESKIEFVKKIFIDSAQDMVKEVFKKRAGCIRFLLIIQLFSYFFLWVNFGYEPIEYLYMLRTFDGFTGADYAYFTSIRSSVLTVFILFIVPRIKCHPSLYCLISIFLQGLTFLILPWLSNIWLYYGTYILNIGYFAVWAYARTLFSLCVSSDDIGKIYAAVGIFASIAPLFSKTMYRKLYNMVS